MNAMKKSIARVGHFPITPGNASGPEAYGTIIWLESEKSGGREYTAEPKGETTEIYADGKAVISVDDNSGYDIKLVLLSLIDDIAIAWLGRTKDADGGLAEYANAGEYPRFGLAIAEDTTDGAGLISYYYNCQISKRPSKSGKTSEGKLEGQYAEFQIAARPRASDSLICYEKTGKILPTAVPEPVAAVTGTGTGETGK